MKKVIDYFMMGVGIGSIIYILCLLLYGFEPTWENALIDWLASGLMGVSSLIYDHPKWSAFKKRLLSMLSVYLLVMGMLFYNAWLPFEVAYIIGASVQFLFIYGIIVFYFSWQNKDSVRKINQKLANRKINLDKR
ncbi:DUF3021 domain-containing protein [Streptococcus halotolerans]|uniref:DUF3021 domain-containing protein n=1 Tax=Streptococcus halotolerans TaxID=1814128 RepID=UPI000786B2C4|nr:DUF3021 domain-containing protein [Streptococcus halotolerans]